MRRIKSAAPLLTALVLVLTALTPAHARIAAAVKKPAPMWEFTLKGQVLGPIDVGLSTGSDIRGVSDESVVVLPDRRIRLYFNKSEPGKAHGIVSAISTDGVHFTLEAGERISPAGPQDNVGSGFVYSLPTGGYRLFRSHGGAIVSSTSSDGLTFTPDPGERLAGDAWGASPFGPPVCSAIAQTAGGKYRMYCTLRLTGGGPGNPGLGAVVSAVSGDLLTWTAESGRRLGPGTNLPADAGHPSVIKSAASGATTLVYHSYNYPYNTNDLGSVVSQKLDSVEIIVSSKDGLSFSKPIITGVRGSEVAWAAVSPTKAFMYVGWADKNIGAAIGVATASWRGSGLGLNPVGMPVDGGGGVMSIALWSAPKAVCTVRVKDKAGRTLTDSRLQRKVTVPTFNVASWSWSISLSTAEGRATATFSCKLGTWKRVRSATFALLRDAYGPDAINHL